MDYKTVNDYELVYLIRESDELAYNLLYEKYQPLITHYAKQYYSSNNDIGLDIDDLYQEGMCAFENALGKYDNETCLFYTYVTICIRREMEKLIKTYRRHKNSILNEANSLNKYVRGMGELNYEDIIGDDKYSVEGTVIDSFTSTFIHAFKYELDFEKANIFELRLNGFTNKEISVLLDAEQKTIDNMLRKIRKKFIKYHNKIAV